MKNKIINIPIEYKPIFNDNWREAAIFGGRFSLKSHTVARYLLIKAREKKTRVACFREFQSSIAESSHQLLSELINLYGLADFNITNNSIVNKINGSDFIFKGLWNNEQSIKSIEGIDIAWCFIAGTLVDEKPIEKIKIGDYIKSYNHKLNKIEYRKVLKISKTKAPLKLYKLLTLYGDRYIIGTGEHPVFTESGYIPLKDLTIKNNVYEEIKFTKNSTLFGWLWRRNRDEHSREKTKICKKWWNFLLGLCEKKGIGENENKQPNGQQGDKRKNGENIKENWAQAKSFRWKWSWLYKSTTIFIQEIRERLVERIDCYAERTRKRKGYSNKLQGRFSKCLLYVSSRMRWWLSYWTNRERTRQKEKSDIKETGVDSVEIQEQGDIEQLRLSDKGNYVYNLEVEVNNNYFANGILVHNCEEAQSISAKSIEVLTPTVRKEKSKIIYTYNRLLEEDPVHNRLVIEGRPDTLIINVNYDIAIKYGMMPDVILKEIEDDKKNRPGLYKHKWLGEPHNMERKIYKNWKIIDEIPHEARLERYGLDFGYSVDFTAIVAIYYYNGGYIIDEICYQKGLLNKPIADILKNLPYTLTIADSAEPKSIAEIRSYGINIIGAKKRKENFGTKETYVKWSIGVVQEQKISVTKRSINIIKAYKNYLWKTDKEEKVLNEPDHYLSDCMDAIRYGIISLAPIINKQDFLDTIPIFHREAKTNPAR